jgi:hypothetical protein
MLRKDRLRKGVEALRSGEFIQGMGMLRLEAKVYDDNLAPTGETVIKYCCLGVLTEVAVRDPEFSLSEYDKKHVREIRARRGQLLREDPTETLRLSNLDPEDSNSVWAIENGILTDSVRRYYGLSDDNPEMKVPESVDAVTSDGSGRIPATTANDEYCWNFNQIANAFEATFLQDDDATPTSD